MADFCKQCSEELGFLNQDLTNLCEKGWFIQVLCEGCGYIYVDHDGHCMGCLDGKHKMLNENYEEIL